MLSTLTARQQFWMFRVILKGTPAHTRVVSTVLSCIQSLSLSLPPRRHEDGYSTRIDVETFSQARIGLLQHLQQSQTRLAFIRCVLVALLLLFRYACSFALYWASCSCSFFCAEHPCPFFSFSFSMRIRCNPGKVGRRVQPSKFSLTWWHCFVFFPPNFFLPCNIVWAPT